jgi:hypothetical protein
MTTQQKSPSKDFIEAVKTLGGPLHASRLTGTPRVTLMYWMKNGYPYYRQHEVDKLIELARKAELETLQRLQRKYQEADAEKLERARHMVLDADERKRRKAK